MNYPPEKTAVILVDPFNDFLSEGGKLYSFTKETVEGTGIVRNMKELTDAARENGILVVYAPHHRTQPGDFAKWKFKSPSHLGSEKYTLFEKDRWVGSFILTCCLKMVI